jgi:hypothetical protein
MMFKSEKRERAKRNARKMRVHGKSVFVIRDAQRKRDEQYKQAREAKRISPITT